MIADEPSGRVLGSRAPFVSYRLAKADEGRLADAIEAMARVMLAAGARDVELGGGAPPVRSEAELEAAMQRLDVRRLRSPAFTDGTAAAGSDPARHPVDPEGRLRGVEGLGRRRLDPAELPRGQSPGLDHGDRRWRRRGCERGQ